MRIALYSPKFGTAHTPESLSDIIVQSDTDLFVGAEYLLFASHSRRMYPLDKEERKTYLDALRGASTDRVIVTPMLWTDGRHFYNSVPIIYDGRMVSERYKRHTSDTESVFADAWRTRFAPMDSKPITTVDGIDLRVEICLDFPFILDFGEADIHVLCASGIDGDLLQSDKWRVKDGGDALVVDNQPVRHGYRMAAHRRVDDEFIPHVPKRSTAKMQVYEVEL